MVDFIPNKKYNKSPLSGHVSSSLPSNIALVKYWGKKENQIPTNPSLSFSLSKCRTETTVYFKKLESVDGNYHFEILLDRKPKAEFRSKISNFFNHIFLYLPFLKQYHFRIESSNSFPHSSGIASSASSMSALATCLLKIEMLLGQSYSPEFLYKKASFLARLGSGSACRSIWGGIVSWGKHSSLEGSSELWGTPMRESEIHPIFRSYQDCILLIDKNKKEISSSLGHQLMNAHPFRESRSKQAQNHFGELIKIIGTGDVFAFIDIVESEALTLHGLMMSSSPHFILMKPATLEVIRQVRDYRKETGRPLCFTLDAGANVHLLYPKEESKIIFEFIKERLLVFCENKEYICDEAGLINLPSDI